MKANPPPHARPPIPRPNSHSSIGLIAAVTVAFLGTGPTAATAQPLATVEIPVFDGTPDDYAAIGRMLDGIGLGRTAISIIPGLDQNPLSEDPADRQLGVDHLDRVVDPFARISKRLREILHRKSVGMDLGCVKSLVGHKGHGAMRG